MYGSRINDTITDGSTPVPTHNEDQYTGFRVSFIPYVIAIDVISTIGVVGNILIILLMTSPALRRKSIAVYVMFLAVCDSLVLITIATEDTTDHIFQVLSVMYSSHIVFCKLWIAVSEFCRLVSPWLLVAMTFDRYIAIVFPLHRPRVCSQKFALVVCIGICVVGLVLLTPILCHLKHVLREDGLYDCDLDDVNIRYYDMTLVTLMNSVLPVTCLTVLTIQTAVVLRRISKRLNTGNSNPDVNFINITVSIILVSTLSGITLVPFAINSLIEFVLEITDGDFYSLQLSGSIWHLLNVVRLLNYAMNFYVLIIFFGRYRSILRKRLTCEKHEGEDEERSRSTHDEGEQMVNIVDMKTIGL